MPQVQVRPDELVKILRADFPMPAIVSLGEQVLAGAGSFTWATIPQIYRNLKIIANLRATKVANSDFVMMRFGTGGGAVDAGANYNNGQMKNVNTTYTGSSNINQAFAYCGIASAASATAGASTSLEITIANYRSAFFKSLVTMTTLSMGVNTAATTELSVTSAIWKNIGAIDQILLYDYTASGFEIGSYAELYGIY